MKHQLVEKDKLYNEEKDVLEGEMGKIREDGVEMREEIGKLKEEINGLR